MFDCNLLVNFDAWGFGISWLREFQQGKSTVVVKRAVNKHVPPFFGWYQNIIHCSWKRNRGVHDTSSAPSTIPSLVRDMGAWRDLKANCSICNGLVYNVFCGVINHAFEDKGWDSEDIKYIFITFGCLKSFNWSWRIWHPEGICVQHYISILIYEVPVCAFGAPS